MTQKFYSRYILKRNETICPHRKSYMNVCNRIVHYSQKVKATQIAIP